MSAEAVLPGNLARLVIDPHAYAEWDGLLDTFDAIRASTPVVKVQPDTPGLFDPFWLVTSYDDAMRISKDNAAFLNNPRPVVFSFNQAIEFSRAATGSNMLVDSLVVFDAPIHPKYRKLTQEWFMPRNLARLEDELRGLAARTVDRMLEQGVEVGTGNGDDDGVDVLRHETSTGTKSLRPVTDESSRHGMGNSHRICSRFRDLPRHVDRAHLGARLEAAGRQLDRVDDRHHRVELRGCPDRCRRPTRGGERR